MPSSLDALIARAAEKPVALARLARALAAHSSGSRFSG
jgi:hypothetical protein